MGKNGPLGRGDDGRGTRVRVVGPSRARPAALKGATGRIGKIPTYVKRSRASKSARSFSPKFRAGRRRVSPTPSPTSTNPANVCLTRPGAPAPPLEPFLGVRIFRNPKSRTCIEKPLIMKPTGRARCYGFASDGHRCCRLIEGDDNVQISWRTPQARTTPRADHSTPTWAASSNYRTLEW